VKIIENQNTKKHKREKKEENENQNGQANEKQEVGRMKGRRGVGRDNTLFVYLFNTLLKEIK